MSLSPGAGWLQIDLSADEAHALRSAVRREIRHADSTLHTRLAKFGDAYDTSRAQEWIGWLESALVKLGGDPSKVARKERVGV